MHSEPSVHDNVIYAYSVNCEQQQVILHTAFRDRQPHEFTDVVFRDVVAHHFEHVLKGNIVCDIEEVDVDWLVHNSERVLSDSWRYGWPQIEYRGDLDALIRALKAASVRAY